MPFQAPRLSTILLACWSALSPATVEAQKADERGPQDSASILLDRAKELFVAGKREAGLEAYRAATARATSNEPRARLRADLAWIADSAELRRFDATAAAGLPAWVDAFWERRDVRDVRRPGERLAEHYRRLAYAEAHFPRLGRLTANTDFEPLERDDRTLDDRAVIYIRHGEPDKRASFGSPFESAEHLAPQQGGMGVDGRYIVPRSGDRLAPIPPNLSWKYQQIEGDLIFHFVARHGSDYRLMESLLDVYSADTVVKLQMAREESLGEYAGPQIEWGRFAGPLVSSRADFDPVYARLANSMTIQGSGNLQRERATGRHSIEVGTTTDSYRQVFEKAMDPFIQAYGLSRQDEGRILLVIGVPKDRLRGRTIAVRAVVSTAQDQRLLQLDSVFSLASSGESGFLGGFIELAAPSGAHRVRIIASDKARRAAGAAMMDPVVVPVRSGPPSLSDLVLGERGGLGWPVADGAVWLDADGAFAPGTTVQLYYQAFGLTSGTTYRTRIEFRRAGHRKGERRIASVFDLLATGTTRTERRELSLAGLRKGDYVLQLSLAGPSDTVTRTRPFRVG